MRKIISAILASILILTVFINIPAAAATAGDVDGDGIVTVSDALLLLRMAAELIPEPSELGAADLNGDGKVSVADALCALRTAIGLLYEPQNLSDAVKDAEVYLYQNSSAETRAFAFSCYDNAVTLLDSGETEGVDTAVEELRGAINSLVPMTELSRAAEADDTAEDGVTRDYSIKPVGAEYSLMLTADGDGAAHCGAFEFSGSTLADCGGLALWVSSDVPAYMTVTLSLPAEQGGGEFTVSGIYVSNGYVYIPFERFSPYTSFPANPGVCSISLSFSKRGDTAPTVIRTADMFAFRELLDTASQWQYTEKTVGDEPFDTSAFYRLSIKLRVLAFGPAHTETELKWDDRYLENLESGMGISAKLPSKGDYTQQWAIVPVDDFCVVVNRETGAALQFSSDGNGGYTVTGRELDLNNPLQQMIFTYTSAGYIISVDGIGFLGYADSKFTVASQETDAAYFELTAIYDSAPWELKWSDEFEGTELDRSVWTPDNGKDRPDYEPVYYRDSEGENFYVTDGNLVIHTIRENYNSIPMTSAQISTAGNVSFSYGRYEIRAKLATGNYIWPAFWLLGNDYGVSPLYGEIDIVELEGGEAYDNGDSYIFGSVHWPRTDDASSLISKSGYLHSFGYENLADEYHIYAIEWDDDQIRWYLDDILYGVLSISNDKSRWTFGNNTHWIILNTSVRGPGNNEIYPNTPLESFYYIDYVRYYTRSDSGDKDFSLPENVITPSRTRDLVYRCASVVAATDGTRFYLPTTEGKLISLIQSTGTLSTVITNAESLVGGATSPDGNWYACGSEEQSIYVVDTDNLFSSPLKITNPGTLNDVMAFTADSETLLATGRGAWYDAEGCRYIRGFTARTGEKVFEYNLGSFARCISVASTGVFAVGCSDGSVFIFNADFSLRKKLSCGSQVRALAISPDGTLLVTGCDNGSAALWNVENGKRLSYLAREGAAVYTADFSSDGSTFLIGGNDCVGRLYTASGRLITTLGGAEHYLRDSSFSPDGSICAIASQDGTIRIFRSADGAYIKTLSVSQNTYREIRSFAFSSDGRRICASVSTKYGNIAAIWKLS